MGWGGGLKGTCSVYGGAHVGGPHEVSLSTRSGPILFGVHMLALRSMRREYLLSRTKHKKFQTLCLARNYFPSSYLKKKSPHEVPSATSIQNLQPLVTLNRDGLKLTRTYTYYPVWSTSFIPQARLHLQAVARETTSVSVSSSATAMPVATDT